MTPEAVIGEVVKIAMASGLGMPLALAAIVLAAVLIVGLRTVGFKWPSLKGPTGPSEPPLKPGPPVQSGEGGAVVDGNGAPVTTGDPGGGAAGGMG